MGSALSGTGLLSSGTHYLITSEMRPVLMCSGGLWGPGPERAAPVSTVTLGDGVLSSHPSTVILFKILISKPPDVRIFS